MNGITNISCKDTPLNPVKKSKGLFFIILIISILWCCACQANKNYKQAQTSFYQAQAIGAHIFAPFEYTSAEVYLQMSKKLLQDSNFEQSIKYSNKSLEFSKQAIARASDLQQHTQTETNPN